MGAPAKPFPMALGALIIKERLGTSDEETVEQIRENPYLAIIDQLYEQVKDVVEKKPRTYRRQARSAYLQVAKKRRPSQKQITKAIRKQLGYVRRHLAHIDALIEADALLSRLSKQRYRTLLVVSEVYRQQRWMYEHRRHLSWDNFNQSGDLQSQVEQFKERFGHKSESLHVDQIYRTRTNRLWCRRAREPLEWSTQAGDRPPIRKPTRENKHSKMKS